MLGRPPKYHNQKLVRNGETFDSLKEYKRYLELCLLVKAGQIDGLQRQVRFVLIPEQREPDIIGARGGVTKGRLLERRCEYIADFVYTYNGKTVVEDTKSEATKTKDYIIKRKLMLYVNGIKICEV